MRGIIGLFLTIGNVGHAQEVWKSPCPSKKYHEVSFLTSHNSYASKAYDYRYAQQTLSISEQLARGVRGLMLDTYHVKGANDIVVCHGKIFTPLIKKGGAMRLASCLVEIKEFLAQNPQEIITIFLENYVSNLGLLDAAFASSGLADYILCPRDVLSVEENGWPAIGWMQQNNKRLIVFNSNGESKYAFNEWQEVIENQFGTLSIKAAARERKESKVYSQRKRHLYLVNFIPTFKYDFGNSFKLINSMYLKQLVQYLAKHGLGKNHEYKHMTPNFINVDFIEQGNPLGIVNLLNG